MPTLLTPWSRASGRRRGDQTALLPGAPRETVAASVGLACLPSNIVVGGLRRAQGELVLSLLFPLDLGACSPKQVVDGSEPAH